MKNITITLDEETARWARIEAAHRDMSVSRLIGELLHQHMRAQTTYQDAMQRYLARTPTALKDTGRYPAREELHDRAGLRWHQPARLRPRRLRTRQAATGPGVDRAPVADPDGAAQFPSPPGVLRGHHPQAQARPEPRSSPRRRPRPARLAACTCRCRGAGEQLADRRPLRAVLLGRADRGRGTHRRLRAPADRGPPARIGHGRAAGGQPLPHPTRLARLTGLNVVPAHRLLLGAVGIHDNLRRDAPLPAPRHAPIPPGPPVSVACRPCSAGAWLIGLTLGSTGRSNQLALYCRKSASPSRSHENPGRFSTRLNTWLARSGSGSASRRNANGEMLGSSKYPSTASRCRRRAASAGSANVS